MVHGSLPSRTLQSVPAAGYVLRRDGSPIAASEVEHSARLAIEVVILWQGDVLSVSHREPRGSVFLGGRSSCADISLPDELLESESSCIALCTRGEVSAVLPANARGWRTLPDGQRCSLPSAEPSAATGQLLPLPLGNRVHLSLGELELQVAAVPAGRSPARRLPLGFEASTLLYFAISALLVVGTLGVLSRMAPPRGLTWTNRRRASGCTPCRPTWQRQRRGRKRARPLESPRLRRFLRQLVVVPRSLEAKRLLTRGNESSPLRTPMRCPAQMPLPPAVSIVASAAISSPRRDPSASSACWARP